MPTYTVNVSGSTGDSASASLVVNPTSGHTYYTATNGNDSNPGTIAAPFRTVAKGVSVLTPGDTLLIRAGTYAESLVNTIPGGTSSNRVKVAAYPESAPYEVVTLLPASVSGEAVLYFAASARSYITFQGIIVDATNVGGGNAVKITYSGSGASHDIILKDCEIKNAPSQQGVLISTNPPSQNADNNQVLNCKIHNNGSNDLHHGIYITSSNNVIDGNECYLNAGYGIQFYLSDAHNSLYCQNNIIRNNKVHNNNRANSAPEGIVIATGDNNLVYNNLVYNCTGSVGGIQVYKNTNATKVWNNTIYNCGDYGIHIQTGATNTVVQNNICYANASGNIINNGTGSIIDHNTTNVQNPLFVNSASFDFHLTAGSPAKDAGITITQVPVDLDGITRPQGVAYDIGAYEFH